MGITGGVTSMDNFLRQFFPHVAAQSEGGSTNKWCTYNDAGLQMFTASLFLAACLAGLAASPITRCISVFLWWVSASQVSWGAPALNMHLFFLFLAACPAGAWGLSHRQVGAATLLPDPAVQSCQCALLTIILYHVATRSHRP